MCKDLKAWFPVSSHSANIVQGNAFKGQSTKYKCLEMFVLYGIQGVIQGVIQDFEVEGGNEKSTQKMLLKKVNSIPSYGHSVIIKRGDIPLPPPPRITPWVYDVTGGVSWVTLYKSWSVSWCLCVFTCSSLLT